MLSPLLEVVGVSSDAVRVNSWARECASAVVWSRLVADTDDGRVLDWKKEVTCDAILSAIDAACSERERAVESDV